jgi:hypothetical protein
MTSAIDAESSAFARFFARFSFNDWPDFLVID